MTKKEAVRQIKECAEWMIRYRIKDVDFIRDEIENQLETFSYDDWLESCVLKEYSNGFYLGEMENGNRHGYGAYLWYNSTMPNSLYMGEWNQGNESGEGLALKSDLCYSGDFVDGKYQGEGACCVGPEGLVFTADFYNDDITKLIHTTGSFSFKGKHYNKSASNSNSSSTSGNSSKSSDSSSGCVGFIVIAIIIFGLMKFCGNCSNSHASVSNVMPKYGVTATNP